ncbi:hypothetical protein HYPSUDRAFT_210139, partial [Hypholoma sublateritium FD-334 SS-4]
GRVRGGGAAAEAPARTYPTSGSTGAHGGGVDARAHRRPVDSAALSRSDDVCKTRLQEPRPTTTLADAYAQPRALFLPHLLLDTPTSPHERPAASTADAWAQSPCGAASDACCGDARAHIANRRAVDSAAPACAGRVCGIGGRRDAAVPGPSRSLSASPQLLPRRRSRMYRTPEANRQRCAGAQHRPVQDASAGAARSVVARRQSALSSRRHPLTHLPKLGDRPQPRVGISAAETRALSSRAPWAHSVRQRAAVQLVSSI